MNPYNKHDKVIVSTKSQTRKGSFSDRNYTKDEIYISLNELSRQCYHPDEGLTRHKNRYNELLYLCFPEFELCFKVGKFYFSIKMLPVISFGISIFSKDSIVGAMSESFPSFNFKFLLVIINGTLLNEWEVII